MAVTKSAIGLGKSTDDRPLYVGKSEKYGRGGGNLACLRRAQHPPKGVSAEESQLACTVELMRQRGRDMRGT